MGEDFSPVIESGRTYFRYLEKKLMKLPTFKSDLVMAMVSFDYSTLFVWPRLQAFECYNPLFQSFSSREWMGRKLRFVHMDDSVELAVDRRHVYWQSLVAGPAIEDMVTPVHLS